MKDEVMANLFERVAGRISAISGHYVTFLVALGLIIVWAVSGPFFGFSETWELVINTGTTIVTFLMVFLIQNTQNRDGAAVQTKLDELIRSSSADDVFMGIEKLTDKELEVLHERCEQMAKETQVTLQKTKAERAKRASKSAERRRSA